MSLRQVLKRSFIHPGTNIINRSSEATPPTLWAFFLPFPCLHSPDHLRPQKDRSIYCISCIWCGSTGSHWGKLRCSLRSCVFESSFYCIHTGSVSIIVLGWGRSWVIVREGSEGGRLTLQHFQVLKSILFFSVMIFTGDGYGSYNQIRSCGLFFVTWVIMWRSLLRDDGISSARDF